MTAQPPARPAPVDPPATLRWAVRLLLGEALALGVVTLFLGYQNVTATATNVAVGIGVTAFAAAGTGVLAAVARALARRSAGARGPAVVLQIMLLAAGYYMIQGGLAWLGVPVMLLAVLVCFLLVSGPTTRALGLGG